MESQLATPKLPPNSAWPTLSRELLAKRAAAQRHVLQRVAVQEPKVVGRSDSKRGSSPRSPRATASASSSNAAACLDGAELTCASNPSRGPSSAWGAPNRCGEPAADGCGEPANEATSSGPDRSAEPPRLFEGPPSELLLRAIPIENEPALASFHWALSQLSRGEDPDQRVRILAYGASHTQADFYPGYLRAYLQARFGNGGRGFVLLGRVNAWHRTLDTRMNQRGFTVHHARFRKEPTREPLGLFGAALVSRNPGSLAEILTAEDSEDTRFELQYYRELAGGEFDVELDGKRLARISTQPGTTGPGYFAFTATPGQHRIRVRLVGNGPVRLFGVVAETATPGVVLDTLGISGAQMADSLRWDDASFIDAVRRRQPDLITLAYGTNEVFDTARTIAEYESDVRSVVVRLRQAAPAASCLFIAPFDLPSARRHRLIEIVDAQRRLARELGCASWNGLAFMGGNGSITSWASAKPSLATPDHIHLTRRGYVYAGTAMADALLRAYDLDPRNAANARAGQPSALLASPGL